MASTLRGLVDILYNQIGSIDSRFGISYGKAANPNPTNFYGISSYGSSTTGTSSIRGNVISNITQKDFATSASTMSRLNGILVTTFAAGSVTNIDSNTITNLYTNSGTSSSTNSIISSTGNTNMCLIGISNTSANGRFYVTRNRIDSLYCNSLSTASTPSVVGIGSDCATSGGMTVSKQ
jgi:hypothetical protein